MARQTRDQKVERLVREPVIIVAYDPRWPGRFEREKRHLKTVLPAGLVRRIEHFGSTAVPGLAAKPVIDMLVEVSDFAAVRNIAVPILEKQGYEYLWRPSIGDDGPPWYAWFVKRHPTTGVRSHHIHMLTADPEFADHWRRLAFRDYLIANPAAAADYAALKRRLAAAARTDRRAYSAGKSEFIARLTSPPAARVRE